MCINIWIIVFINIVYIKNNGLIYIWLGTSVLGQSWCIVPKISVTPQHLCLGSVKYLCTSKNVTHTPNIGINCISVHFNMTTEFGKARERKKRERWCEDEKRVRKKTSEN